MKTKTNPSKTKQTLIRLLSLVALAGTIPHVSAQARDYGYSFTTPEALATDTPSWNFTLDAAYPNTGDPGTTSNMLIVRGESSGSDHSIVTIAGETAYYVNTTNPQNANFGFFLMNLDFRDVAVGADVNVNYSFKFLANDTNDSIVTTGAQVRYTTAATTPGLASFGNVDQTFSFQDDNATWTTVSGSFTLPTGTGSSRGGILINTGQLGAFTSAGGFYLADLDVTVVPEPSSLMMITIGLLSMIVFIRHTKKRRGLNC